MEDYVPFFFISASQPMGSTKMGPPPEREFMSRTTFSCVKSAFGKKKINTLDVDSAAVRQIQDVIADKMELADAVIGRQFKRFDGVDFIVGQTQTADIAHIRKNARSDHAQIAFLNTQQLSKSNVIFWGFFLRAQVRNGFI